VIIACRTVFVALLVRGHILPESLLALFTEKYHLHRLPKWMIFRFSMAFCAIEPFATTWRADGHLGIQDVLTENLFYQSGCESKA
jgi:hypothetical protein